MPNPLLPVVPEFDDAERALSTFELSWAEYQRGLRTGVRARVSPDGEKVSVNVGGLARVHALLEEHRKEFEAGDKAALIAALQIVCKENVPLPYWLADGIRCALSVLHENPDTSLHHVFGMEKIYPYPTTQNRKRSRKARADMKTKLELYGRVSVLMHIDKMKKTAAIRKAIEGLPIQFRTAFDWFNELDSRQQKHLRAWRGEKLHKLR